MRDPGPHQFPDIRLRNRSGIIYLDWTHCEEGVDLPPADASLYKAAALALNDSLGNCVVRCRSVTGTSLEERIYDYAGIKPTWMQIKRTMSSACEELTIIIESGSVFRACLSASEDLPPEEYVIKDLAGYRLLRRFGRDVKRLATSSTMPAFCDVRTAPEFVGFSKSRER